MRYLALSGLAVIAVLAITAAPGGAELAYDHRLIEGPFATGPDVTRKCLECHMDSARAIMKTSHWTWTLEQKVPGQGVVKRGKKNVINNFCIAVSSNWPRCTSCHIGYGWEDADFDFSDADRVDCLVCHDTTGTYKKDPKGAGRPMGPKPGTSVSPAYPGVDLLAVARNVGEPSRSNCGSCHFFGGGGDRVKHGDLDSSMIDPDREYDVHMGSPGADMSCQDCHVQDGHTIRGNSLVVSPGHPNSLECTDCHEDKPHDQSRINAHTDRVACQTCHIPTFAKGLPTKIYWNWSSAGEDREPETDRFGLPTYQTGKGSFVWDRDIVPHYAWYNGTGGAYAIGDRIKRRGITALNWPEGSRKDRDAKIYPFKITRGIQPYDSYLNHKYLIVPKLYGDGGYWETYDWDRAARLGMESVGLDYSGEMAWTETVMYWKINHMVVPAENALDCLDCHGDRGRLEWRVLGYKKDPMD